MYHQFKAPIDSDIACKLAYRLRAKKSFSHFYKGVDEKHFMGLDEKLSMGLDEKHSMGLDEKYLSWPIVQAIIVQFQFTNHLLSPQEYRLQIKN